MRVSGWLVAGTIGLLGTAIVAGANPRIDDVDAFCTEETAAYQPYRYGPVDLRKEDLHAIDAYRAYLQFVPDKVNSWTFSLYPSLTARRLTFDLAVNYTALRNDEYRTLADYRRLLATPGAKIINPSEARGVFRKLDHIDFETMRRYRSQPVRRDQSAELSAGYSKRFAICAYFVGVFDIPSCAKQFGSIYDYAAPIEGLTAYDSIERVLTDRSYDEGLARAALRVMDQVEGGRASANLYEDLYRSYLESGNHPVDADDRAWEVIAVLSARGPNLFKLYGLYTPENSRSLVALALIAAGTPYLDQITYATGHPYSYPPRVSTRCNFGKPYHFWLTAYLARLATRASGDRTVGSAAGYLFQVGYQALKKEDGRDPLRAFTTPTFDHPNNKIRLDLAAAASGAVYGAIAATSPPGPVPDGAPIDSDENLRILLRDAQEMPVIDAGAAKALWGGIEQGRLGLERWLAIFAARSALENARKNW